MTSRDKPLLRVLAGEALSPPPVWMMRQAGRYLPEYQRVRARAGSFLDLCYTPDLATEVTLQPIHRFGFDAAILFADILLVPQALGADLWFVDGEGPRLSTIQCDSDMSVLKPAEAIHETLAPIFQTVRQVRDALPPATTLIGFAGAPWTVATYMIAGRGTRDQAPARSLMYREPETFARLIDLVTEATILYLKAQIEAGAEVVKIFDSWAGAVPGPHFEAVCIEPVRKIVTALRTAHPEVPVIGFPRQAGTATRAFIEKTGVQACAIDASVDPVWAAAELQPLTCIQGNLDQLLLVTGGDALRRETRRIVEAFSGGSHIFNLGHGITPDALPENVEIMLEAIRG